MKKLTRVIAIALSMMLVFFNEPFFIHAQDEASDFSQFITSASLAYQDAKGYTAYSEDAAITETTPLLFKVEADLPSSALSSDHTINYALPEGLNLDETTSTDVYLKGDETHAVGTYTIKQKNMTIDFSSLDYGSDESKTVIVEIKTTPEHLTFSSTEAKIYFKKATSTSASEVMVSVMQNYQTDSAATENKTTTATKQATSVKTKKAIRKNGVNTVSDGYTEISDNIDNQVRTGLLGKYRLKSLSYINGKIGNSVSINTDVTIDLNGQKLKLYSGVHFDIKKNGHLTIEDSQASKISVDEKGTTNQTGNVSSLITKTQGDSDDRYVPVKLDYYVTKATPKNTTTEDQTIKYEADLSSAGRIYSETGTKDNQDSTFFIEKGGVLDFKSGVAYNTGPHVVATQYDASNTASATFNLSGGYLIGNQSGSVLYNNSNNNVSISGGLITHGKNTSGGGIYNKGGQVDLTGGIITGNEASGDGADTTNERYSGGGIYMSSGTLNISDNAYITNNNKSSGVSTGDHAGIHGGGGVAADNNTTVNMSGGYVTGNYSHEAGGGLYIGYYTQNGNAKFTLTGGIIASNVAETGEGGGIRIGGQGRATVKATRKNHPIYITNNKTNTGTSDNGTGDWGGGGIFIQTNGQMVMMNALITGNNADGFGAGVSACPTGQTKIVTEQGAAIYGNTAKGVHYSRGSNGKSEDQSAYEFYNNNRTDYQDYFLAHLYDQKNVKNPDNDISYKVTNAMLGGGSENYSGTFNNGVSEEQIYDNAKFIGLSADPSPKDKKSALNQASTYISGNYSHNHGAGIMTNGILTLGESNDIFPVFHLNAYKAYLLKSADQKSSSELAMKNDQFKFAIYKHTGEAGTVTWDGTKFSEGSGTNTLVAEFENNGANENSLGKISAEIPNLYYDEAGDYTFYFVEKDNGDQKISYDHSIYQIKFSVVKDKGTKTVDNVQTTTYSLQNIAVNKISGGKSKALSTQDYTYSKDDSLLTLYNKDKAAFSNMEQSYDFSLTKKDQDHPEKVLADAEFTLYQLGDQDQEKVALTKVKTMTTDDNGRASFSSLRKDHLYYLKETEAPAHYETAGPWIIQVSENGELTFYEADCTENSDCTSLTKNSSKSFVKGEIELTHTNNVYSTTISDTPVKYTMPNTGGKGTQSYYQLGFLLLSVVNVLWIIKRRVV